METIFLEVNFNKTMYISIREGGGYNPKTEYNSTFLDHLSKGIDKYISKYENILILGDLKAETTNDAKAEFCQMYNLKNIIKEPTCYKNPNNPSSVDEILTNRDGCFSNSIAIETGLSDHHKIILSVLNTYIKKREPTVIHYGNYKKFKERLSGMT